MGTAMSATYRAVMMRRIGTAIVLHGIAMVGSLALIGLLTAHSAVAQGVSPAAELKLSVVVAPLYPMGAAAKAWGDALNDGDKDSFTVKFFPGAQLANRDATQEFQALKAGQIDLAVGSALQWSDAFPPLAAVNLPWISPGNKQLTAVIADADVQKQLTAALDAVGVTLVAIAPLRHRDLATQSRVIAAPADLKDLRVRVRGAKLVTDTYVALGAQPTGLALADAQAAFAAGTLDGQDAAAVTLVAARAWATGAHHVVQWGAFANAMVFTVRKPLWQTWPEATRTMVREAAIKAIDSAKAYEREHAAHDELARNGITLTRTTSAGHAAFRAAVEPVYQEWTPRIGASLVEAVRSAAAKAAPAAGN
jgi:TRAP-type C4-dicarboxylate transport system substrate-binding protein